MLETVFIISLSFIAYVYVGYPLAVAILGRIVSRPVRTGPCEPTVTVVIAAYNEEEYIGATIENKLVLDYPKHKLEIIVASDGSADRTDDIVRSYAHRGVTLIRQEPRAGKTSALNLAVPRALGEIVVFSDANSLYAPDALRKLTANFADERVGYVTGRMVYVNSDGSTVGEGCGAYMTYENRLRKLETHIGSVVGVDGGIDAVLKRLYRPMKPDQLPDFVLPLMVVEQGYRVVFEPQAVLREPSLKVAGDEYRMRVRVSLRALWALYDMKKLLVPWRDPLFAWQLWSHKVLRYLCFVFLVGAWASNAFLLDKGILFRIFFALQSAAYASAIVLPLLERNGGGCRLFTFARYFALINLAAAHAFWKFVRGHKQVLWTPRKG